MSTKQWRCAAAVVAALVGASGCGGTGGDEPVVAGGSTTGLPEEIPTAHPDPADFVGTIDNPYLPFVPGSRWVYRSTSDSGAERIVVTVTDRTRQVAGVTATVVHDRVIEVGGGVIEDTYDWYAQDVEGNVWYLGEDTTSYEDGKASTEGSWEAGVDGAEAGLVMPAEPRPGQAYQQEYYAGEAEDEAEVLAVDESVDVPLGHFDAVVETADSTPLEPRLRERKLYAPGVGVVMERDVAGGSEVVRLVRFDRPHGS